MVRPYHAYTNDRGATTPLSFRRNGLTVDLTGWTALSVWATPPSGGAAVEWTDDIAVTTATSGLVTKTWGDELTEASTENVDGTPDAHWTLQMVAELPGAVAVWSDPIELHVGDAPGTPGEGPGTPEAAIRRYVVIGDSISSDPFATDLAVVPWPRLLSARMRNAAVHTDCYTRGVPSRAFTDWTEAYLYEAVREYDATDAIVYLGTNDLLNGGAMGLVFLMARANTVFDYLASLGLRVHAVNIAPLGMAAGDPDEVTRQAYNPWLLGGGATAPETMIDIDILLRDGTDPNLLAAAYDHGDGVHPSNAGHVLIADAVGDALGLP